LKTLTFNLKNNLSVLHDELQATFPSLRPVPRADGRIDAVSGEVQYEATMRVEGIGDSITLTVPQDTDEDAIRVVIEAHDSTVTQPDIRQDRHKLMAALVELDRVHPWTPEQLHEIVTLAIEELLE